MEKIPDERTSTFQQDVLERLRRLEDIVIEKREPDGAGEQVSPSRPWQKAYPTPLNSEKTPAMDVEWLEGEVTYPASTVGVADYPSYGRKLLIAISTGISHRK